MFWKKNALSYVFWLLYALVWGSMVVFSSLNYIMPLPVLESLTIPVRMLVAVLPVLMIPVIGILVRRFITGRFIHEDFNRTGWKIAEYLLIIIIMALGIWLRVDSISTRDIQIGAYSQAMVTEGSSITYLSHGATYLYMQLLRGLFLLFGNKLFLASWLQVILFYIAGIFLYQGTKKVVGKLPSLGVYAFFILAPYFRDLSIELSPLGLYLALYFFCLFYLTEVLRNMQGKPLQYFFGGVQVAVCIYLDFIGVTLVFWAILLLLMHNMQSPVVKKWRVCLFTFGGGLLLGGILLPVADMLLTRRSILQVLQNWWFQYAPQAFSFEMDYFNQTPGILQAMILIMGLLGIISFWFRKKTDRLCPMVFLMAVVVLMVCFGIPSKEMSYDCWIVILLLLVAFVGFFDVFDLTDRAYLTLKLSSDLELDETELQAREEMAQEEVAVVTEEVQNAPEQIQKPVQFLENPLPVPKRHERRTMDYPITDISEDDDFDIQISEDDDFDYNF